MFIILYYSCEILIVLKNYSLFYIIPLPVIALCDFNVIIIYLKRRVCVRERENQSGWHSPTCVLHVHYVRYQSSSSRERMKENITSI